MNLFVGVSIARVEKVRSESWARVSVGVSMRVSVNGLLRRSGLLLRLLLSRLLEVLVESRDGLLNERILDQGSDELAKVFGTNWEGKKSSQVLVGEKLFGLCDNLGDELIRALEVWDSLHKLIDFGDDELVSLLSSGASPGLQELEDLLGEWLSGLSWLRWLGLGLWLRLRLRLDSLMVEPTTRGSSGSSCGDNQAKSLVPGGERVDGAFELHIRAQGDLISLVIDVLEHEGRSVQLTCGKEFHDESTELVERRAIRQCDSANLIPELNLERNLVVGHTCVDVVVLLL